MSFTIATLAANGQLFDVADRRHRALAPAPSSRRPARGRGPRRSIFSRTPTGTAPTSFTYTAFDGDQDSAAATASFTVSADRRHRQRRCVDQRGHRGQRAGAGERHVRGHARRSPGPPTAPTAPSPSTTTARAGDTTDDFVVYTPNADFNGSDSFTYTVTSGGVTETATVNVTVNAVVDIADDTATTNEDVPVNILVLGNDTLRGHAGHHRHHQRRPRHGGRQQQRHAGQHSRRLRRLHADRADFNGADMFTYTVTSGGVTETATVNVTINAVADIADDTATTNEDTAVNVLVLANDTFEGTEAITGTTNGANGTVTVNNNGTAGDTTDDFVVYTPNADFNGSDTFTYTVTSGGVTETATVNVTINAVADIANDSATTNEDTAVNVLVLAQRHVREHRPAITGITNGANGAVTLNDNGTAGDTTDDFVVYTPNADFNGSDSFTYTVTSGGVTETATVNVTINAVADIADDSATTNEDTAVNVLVLANDTFESTDRRSPASPTARTAPSRSTTTARRATPPTTSSCTRRTPTSTASTASPTR